MEFSASSIAKSREIDRSEGFYRIIKYLWSGFRRDIAAISLALSPFAVCRGYTLCLFWSGIGYGFRGNDGVYERIYRFNSR